MSDIIFAKGNVKNVLKRIGAYKSNLFCFGEDPITKSGVIISNGEIILWTYARLNDGLNAVSASEQPSSSSAPINDTQLINSGFYRVQ